ncbi:MAG TPA: fused MFS/spermidine synthase [Thermoanaerobaculia bacterium]|jgi:spermidine synthase|nr:fused MFS/spermidine synthase [Thermoanaerobaculia bacterium]
MLWRLRFYWVVGACGGVLMALEILSSRILAPYFGNSVYVWGSIISVFLGALSLGYLWGGRLADRHPSLAALARLLALASACQEALLLAGSRSAAALAGWTGASPAGTLLAAAALFGPASVLLATVSPYAVRLAARDLGRLGDTAGRLYALSTLGSLGGTLVATFLLIPFFELRHVLALLTAATAATALAAAAGGDAGARPPEPSGSPGSPGPVPVAVRAKALAPALLALLVLAAALAAFRPDAGLGAELLYQRTTPYQTLVVKERAGVRYLESDRVQQAAVQLADGEPAMRYPRFAAASLLLNPRPRRLLALGMGGGSVGSYLQRRLPELGVDYVDIDPAVPEIAQRFLLLRTGPSTTITVADGRRFLAGAAGRAWDVVYCDTYIGRSVPFHLTTIEFLDEVKRHLAAGGSFGLNLAAGLADPFSRAMYRTVVERFNAVYLFKVGGASNVLVLASDAPVLLRPQLLARARELDRMLPGFDPSFTSMARSRMAVGLEAVDVPLLRDDFAPVDRLIHLGAAARGDG